jgi:PAS domain S-box-containing protein
MTNTLGDYDGLRHVTMSQSNQPTTPVPPPPPLSAERMQAMIDNSWDILSLIDRDGRLIYNSPAAQRLHGFAPDEFAGRNTFDLMHPEDTQRVADAFQRCLAEPGLPVRARYRYARKGGTWIWMEAVAVNLLDNPEVGAIVVNSRDITKQVEAERAVQDSESHFRSLFSNMVQGFALCRLLFKDGKPDDFTYLEVNESFATQTGLRDVVGKRISEIAPGIRESNPELFERYGRVVETGVPERFEVYILALDLWCAISVYRPMEGHFAAVFDVVNDRKKAEAERLRLERQLNQAQKMDSLGSVAGGVAHDMNNVLGSVLMLSSAHEAIQAPDSPAQQAFATITKACQRGRSMVRRLLDFARQDLSELKVLSLNAVVREEVLLLERTTLAQVRFAVELDDDLRAICGDYGALLHALMNLCVNAIDAMPGGGTLTVRTRNAEPGWVELEVVDTGVGMPAEVVEKAMDPFFTTKSHGKGTGLGLSIAYGTVRAHQGTMTLESAPGRGTRVVLRLPSTDITASDSEAPAAPGPEGNARRLDVLLVDDDELIRAAMGPVIQSLGHRVVLTGNAEEALEHLATGERPDVVILDMNMPGLGGKRALPRIRELQPGVPVLLATGRADQEAVDLAQAQPGVTLVPKPISTGELKAHLDAIPDRRPA